MLSVRAIYDGKQLKLLEKVDIQEPKRVIVVFLDYPENEEKEENPITAKDLHDLMQENPALDFLVAEEEDIYSDEDLKVKF
ncbi:MAG: antitoxin AF2212-like protein [Saprospiraceae bacterium]